MPTGTLLPVHEPVSDVTVQLPASNVEPAVVLEIVLYEQEQLPPSTQTAEVCTATAGPRGPAGP